MSKPKISYSVKEADGPMLDRVLSKRGHEVEFTVRDIASHRAKLVKMAAEMRANAALKRALAEKVLEEHPEISDVPKEVAEAAGAYFSAQHQARQYDEKAAECEEVIGEYKDELADIAAALGDEYRIDENADPVEA